MPISTMAGEIVPSIFPEIRGRNAGELSPSVTMSTPILLQLQRQRSGIALGAGGSRLDFQGAHSVLGSASHPGFGKVPAIVVGNSMGTSRPVLIERLCAMSYAGGTEQQKSP